MTLERYYKDMKPQTDACKYIVKILHHVRKASYVISLLINAQNKFSDHAMLLLNF